MEKNYYDILEINKNASQEIIEKAYKILVKKYHPDLQEANLKNKYEEKIKEINEAYEILSDPEKRKNYDLTLKNNEISNEDYNNLYNENVHLKNEINNLKNKNYQNNYSNQEENLEREYKQAYEQAYYNAYIINLKKLGYKIRYKRTYKDYLALLLTIIFLAALGFILWHIPFVKNYFISLYNDNEILKNIIDIFIHRK